MNIFQLKRQIRRQVLEEKKAILESSEDESNKTKHIEYGLGKGSLIPKIYGRTVDKWKNTRSVVLHVVIFGRVD